MNDTLVLVEDCAEWGHGPGPHRHVVFNDVCPHGTPRRFTCSACEPGSR